MNKKKTMTKTASEFEFVNCFSIIRTLGAQPKLCANLFRKSD